MERRLASARIYRFGLFEVDAGGSARRKGVRIKIQDQPFRALILLLEHPGEIVTREELRQHLWPEGTFVDFDGGLNVILKKLRAAIDDETDNPRFIETVPRRGYRFIAPVTVERNAPVVQDADSGSSPIAHTADNAAPSKPRNAVSRRRVAIAAFAGLALLLVGWTYMQRGRAVAIASRRVIAVLPFSNQGAGADFDYLRYAIANDLVTDLTHARSISVRPFASTSRFGAQVVDPAAVGSELRVTHVLTGSFLLENKNLRVNMELVDVAQNLSVWREQITVPPQELIALHDKLAAGAANGLLPAINISGASANEMPSPKNEEALDLFLHSITVPLDPEPNRMAIKQLEKSVSLDSSYAPAWGELGWRYYNDYHYGSGDEALVVKALAAYKRQSDLDPNWPSVATTIRVEQGDLDGAYSQAAAFLRRRPDSSQAHFGMSYVLRYAGLLDDAGKECDASLALDPGFNGLRSCALPFIMAGDYPHAQRYISLDEKFGAFMRLRIALRRQDTSAVLAELTALAQSNFRVANDELAFFRSCVNHAPEGELDKAVAKLEADPVLHRDAELLYQNAEHLAFCGQGDAALRQLRKAIQGNHCSYPAMDKDPLFDPMRQRPEFAEVRQAAVHCQQKFLSYRKKVNAALAAAQ